MYCFFCSGNYIGCPKGVQPQSDGGHTAPFLNPRFVRARAQIGISLGTPFQHVLYCFGRYVCMYIYIYINM